MIQTLLRVWREIASIAAEDLHEPFHFRPDATSIMKILEDDFCGWSYLRGALLRARDIQEQRRTGGIDPDPLLPAVSETGCVPQIFVNCFKDGRADSVIGNAGTGPPGKGGSRHRGRLPFGPREKGLPDTLSLSGHRRLCRVLRHEVVSAGLHPMNFRWLHFNNLICPEMLKSDMPGIITGMTGLRLKSFTPMPSPSQQWPPRQQRIRHACPKRHCLRHLCGRLLAHYCLDLPQIIQQIDILSCLTQHKDPRHGVRSIFTNICNPPG